MQLRTPRTILVVALTAVVVFAAPVLVDGIVGGATPAVHAAEDTKPSVDADAVFYGRTTGFKNPAEVDVDAVYSAIPEYQKLIEKDLEPDDAEYVLLMTKASRRFKKAVRASARALHHDLVARLGAVENADDVPDITQEVIDRL